MPVAGGLYSEELRGSERRGVSGVPGERYAAAGVVFVA
jgi:hypothetical protein